MYFGKSWTKSKTVIVNSLSLTAGLLATAVGSDLVAQYPKTAAVLGSALAAVNIALRFVTVEPLT
jgi:hypothetical protein